MKHFQKYPVVFITFKDIKAQTYVGAMTSIRDLIVHAYQEHRHLLDQNKLNSTFARHFRRVLESEQYATELRAAGVAVVHEYAMAFEGKTAYVRKVDDVLGS